VTITKIQTAPLPKSKFFVSSFSPAVRLSQDLRPKPGAARKRLRVRLSAIKDVNPYHCRGNDAQNDLLEFRNYRLDCCRRESERCSGTSGTAGRKDSPSCRKITGCQNGNNSVGSGDRH